jgi:hypothetical protein
MHSPREPVAFLILKTLIVSRGGKTSIGGLSKPSYCFHIVLLHTRGRGRKKFLYCFLRPPRSDPQLWYTNASL